MYNSNKSVFIFFMMFFHVLGAKNMDVNFQYFNFQTENGKSYIETYINFLSTSINYELISENNFQSSILLEMSIRNDDEMVYYDKYLFLSPVVNDTMSNNYFLDKQIIYLKKGLYELELVLIDKLNKSNSVSAKTEILVDIDNNKPSFSDVMLLETYQKSKYHNILSKSGFDLIPINSNGNHFYNETDSLISFYVEWYNIKTDSLFDKGYLINYYIDNDQSNIPIKTFNTVKKKLPDQVNALIGGFNICNLPSGNYNLKVCLLNKKAKIVDIKNIFFQRKNNNFKFTSNDLSKLNTKRSFVEDFTIIEELAEHISCLLPIANSEEWVFASNQLKGWDIELMKQFFYGFWAKRNPLKPEAEWLKYYKKVVEANLIYGGSKVKGFATDRGYVMLKYGKANFIENFNNDNHNISYEIWRFNSINNQSNRDFVFADISMNGNDLKLIHSSVRGEVFNPKWRDLVTRK